MGGRLGMRQVGEILTPLMLSRALLVRASIAVGSGVGGDVVVWLRPLLNLALVLDSTGS